MYRVMLIDDEPSARRLLKASINWEQLGMEVVGEAASGIEAINVIDEMQPDIAFVDISMPFMNGIEFTKVATARYPELVIIIMTAMDDFEYARQCVRLPVFEYMLKPFVRNEVTEVLERIKGRLDASGRASRADLHEDMQDDGAYETEADRRADHGRSDDHEGMDDAARSMEQIRRYISSEYADPQLNLTSVALTFGFSSSYLSRRFKQETGKNFVEYLNECRMERAKELACSGGKMFCVSTEVGIPDPNYFGRCFKKYTGMSYSEYVAAMQK